MPSVDAGNAEARPDAGNADAQTDAGNVESWHGTVNAGRDARARRPPPTRVWRRVLTPASTAGNTLACARTTHRQGRITPPCDPAPSCQAQSFGHPGAIFGLLAYARTTHRQDLKVCCSKEGRKDVKAPASGKVQVNPREFQGNSRKITGNFQGNSWGFPEIPRSGTFQPGDSRESQRIPGNIKGFSWMEFLENSSGL